MSYDLILEEIGEFGKWQKLVFFLAGLCGGGGAFLHYAWTFVGFMPEDYRCYLAPCDGANKYGYSDNDFSNYSFALIDNDTLTRHCNAKPIQDDMLEPKCSKDFYDQSDFYNCTEWVFSDADNMRSLAMELDLVDGCDDPNWPLDPLVTRKSLVDMIYMTGMLIGSYVFGVLSDVLGRRKSLLLATFCSGAILMAGAFVHNYWGYTVLRFFAGIFGKGNFLVAFLIVMEIVGTKYKMYLGILITVFSSSGAMAVGLLAYLAEDWYNFQGLCAIMMFLLCIVAFFVPESPRWLMSKGRAERAERVIMKGARLNGKKTFSTHLVRDAVSKAGNKKKEEGRGEGQDKQYSARDLFRDRRTATITVIMFINWIASTMGSYGLGFNSVNLGSDIYITFVLTAFIEIPSYIFCVLVIDRLGRKPVLIFCQVFAGVTCIAAGFSEVSWLTTTLTLAGKFGVAAAFAIVYLYTAELYPTAIRGTAVGACSAVARIGGILAPFIIGIKPVSVPLFIMGMSCLVGGIMAVFLPETLGAPLPETLEDVRRLHKTAKPWYRWMTRQELKELREAHMAEQKAASAETANVDEKGAKSPAAAAVTVNDVPEVVVSNGLVVPDIVLVSATPEVKRKADTTAAERTENEAFESEDDSEPSDGEGETEGQGAGLKGHHPAVVITPSLEKATEEAIKILEASLPPSPEEEKPDPFVVAAVVHANGDASSPKKLSIKLSSAEAAAETDVQHQQTPPSPIPDPPPPPPPVTPPPIIITPTESRATEIKSPFEVKMGSNFTMIPTDIRRQSIKEEDEDEDEEDKDGKALNDLPPPHKLIANMISEEIKERSRRFSQLPPASVESPDAVKMGSKFTMIPTNVRRESIKEEDEEAEDKGGKAPVDPPPQHKLLAKMISEEIKERSRRFSQLPPASVESPDAVKMGSKFTMIPTDLRRQNTKEEDQDEKDKGGKAPDDPMPPHKLIAKFISEDIKERSRRFSQLPPASVESPEAVKMGSKFTMIPTDASK